MTSRSLEDACSSIEAEIGYLAHSSGRNRRFCSPHADLNTAINEMRQVTIRDGRAIHDRFDLDTHGFAFVRHTSAVTRFEDSAEIKAVYEPESLAIIRQLTGASRVACVGSALRTAGDAISRRMAPPAAEAHVDFESRSARARAQRMYQQSFPGAPGYQRFIASSFWRPISTPPQDWPLALCDWRSVRDDEGVRNVMVVVDKIPEGEALQAEIPGEENLPAASIFPYSEAHRWWYFSNMTRDEALLLKFFDSDQSRAWRVPHSSFRDTSAAQCPGEHRGAQLRVFRGHLCAVRATGPVAMTATTGGDAAVPQAVETISNCEATLGT
jgi:hypothetical protein